MNCVYTATFPGLGKLNPPCTFEHRMIILTTTFCSGDEFYIPQLTLLSITDNIFLTGLILTDGTTKKQKLF